MTRPQPGEAVLHCGHLQAAGNYHLLSRRITFRRGDGTRDGTPWFFYCDECRPRVEAALDLPLLEGLKVMVGGSGRWRGATQ